MNYADLLADPNLIARHLLDDNADSNIIDASVGSDGSLCGATWATNGGNTNSIATDGPYGGALNLNGVDQAIGIPCVVGTAGAVCFRVRLDSMPTGQRYLLSHRNGVTGSRIYLDCIDNTTIRLTYANGSLVSGPSLAVGQWYSVVVTWSGNTCRLYVDGSLAATATGSYSGGWLGRYTLCAFSQASIQVTFFTDATVSDSLTFNRLLIADEAAEYHAGPGSVPENLSPPTLTIDSEAFAGSVGSWDAMGAGPLEYEWELRDNNDTIIDSGTGTTISGSGSFNGSYYLWVQATNSVGSEEAASSLVEVGGGEPAEGSGTAPLVASTMGEGRTYNRGQGTTALSTSSQGEGWRASSGNGQNTLSTLVVGEGYYLPSGYGESLLTLSTNGEGSSGAGGSGEVTCIVTATGEGHSNRRGNGSALLTVSSLGIGYRQSQGSGELPAIITTIGEGYATTGSYGETLLLASASGQGYVIRSGAGLAVMQVGTIGNGQSTEPASSGILALQTINGLYLIGF